jgi:hypothetical protein
MNVEVPNPDDELLQQPIPAAPRISIVNTIEAHNLRTHIEENPELYDMLKDAYKQNLPSYTTYINVFGGEKKHYGSMYEHVNRIKENLTTEQYSQIVDEFNDKYINKNVLTALENNSYAQMIEKLPYLKGMITGYTLLNNDGYDSFRKHVYVPRMVASAPDTNIDSITNDLERMSLNNQDPYGTYALYINILVELSKEFTKKNSNTVRFGGGNYITHNLESLFHIQLIGIFILCDHYFDKMEFLFQKYADPNSNTKRMLEDRIDFYNGLIEGRNDKMKDGFFSNVPLLFDLKYTTTSSIAYENEVDIRDLFFRKDLLYMRLKKAKQDKSDFNKNRNANKTFSKLFLRQSKYIPIISASSFIMKGIIKAAKDDPSFLNTDLAQEIENIKLNLPNEVLLNFVFKLSDDNFEKYFENWLKTCNRASLKKVFKILNDSKQYTELYNPPKGTNNDWIEELLSLFEIRASEITNASEGKVQLPQETVDLIYQFAHKYYGGQSRKKNNIKLKYKAGTNGESDYKTKIKNKKYDLLKELDNIQYQKSEQLPDYYPYLKPATKPPIISKKEHKPLTSSLLRGMQLPKLPNFEGGSNEEKLKDAKASHEAAIAAQAAIDMERTLMPPPPPGIKKVKKSESYVPITQEKSIPNKPVHPSKQPASRISLLKNKTDLPMMPFMDDESVKDFNPQNIQSPEKKSKKGGRKTLKLKKKKCNCKNSIKNYLK